MELQKIDQKNAKYVEAYVDNLNRLNKSPHTIKNYEADLKKFNLWLKYSQDLKLDKVNGKTINDYKDFLSLGEDVQEIVLRNNSSQNTGLIGWFKGLITGKVFKSTRVEKYRVFLQAPLSVSSKRRHLSSLKNFFEYLKETHEDYGKKFEKNPVKSKIHAVTLKEIDVTPTTMIHKEDFLKIEEKIHRSHERLMLYLLYYGGLRLSELTHLKTSNFDMKSRTITFNRKGGYVHTLVIQKEEKIFRNFKFFIDTNEFKSDYLFQNKKGIPLSTKAMYNRIVKIIERAIPDNAITTKITPHSFRKACATNLYLKSKDLLYVRDYLNHKDAKITQTYIDKGSLAKVAKRYN